MFRMTPPLHRVMATMVVAGFLGFNAPSHAASASALPPLGVYLLYPEQAVRPTSEQCASLVGEVRPSKEKAEAWLWGRAPMNWDLEFYLFVSPGRIDTTYAAEGDYDVGTVRFGQTSGGTTALKLTPDEHPDVTIDGTIEAQADSEVVVLDLRGIPGDRGSRTAYFCRFRLDEVT